MPQQLIVFANDCMGNKFCFDADRIGAAASDARAIWFFDHDFETVEPLAASFDEWIDAYCDIEPWVAPDHN